MNLPWSASQRGAEGPHRTRCGWEFGPGPPGWWSPRTAPLPRAFSETIADLERIRALGARDVRMFVLANGVNYPVGEPLDLEACVARPPRLPAEFVYDFDRLLAACARVGVRLWPSLVSFELFHPLHRFDAGVSAGGRAELVFGRGGGARAVDRFLDATLDPFLAVARARADAIGAIEVINEPDWVVRKRRLDPRGGAVPRAAMGRFVVRAVRRIVDAGLLATVGFSDPDVPWLPWGDRRELARLAARGEYVHQLHHYPGEHHPRTLRPHAELAIRPCIVGELPTSLGTVAKGKHMRWEDPGLAEADPSRFLLARLALLLRLGYPGAFVWGLNSADGATSWAEGQAEQLRAFADGLSG